MGGKNIMLVREKVYIDRWKRVVWWEICKGVSKEDEG